MEIDVAVVKLHKNTFLKVKAFQADIVLDEAERTWAWDLEKLASSCC